MRKFSGSDNTLGALTEIKEMFDIVIGSPQKIESQMGNFKYDGYSIKTNRCEFCILINNEQNCCESWGFFSSNTEFGQFIGKELKEIHLEDVKSTNASPDEGSHFINHFIRFVNCIFSDGSILQFVVYNSQNGQHSHDIIFMKDGEAISRIYY